MEDEKIVELYFERNEFAITETQTKYSRYLHTIAYNILYSDEDSEECVNDTYVKAWESMPPHKPDRLSAFLGKITRNLALNKYLYNSAIKRSANNEAVLDEIEELIPNGDSDMSDELALREAINGFLTTLPSSTRIIFVQRYWYMLTVKEIAKLKGVTESNVKVILLRTREKFKAHLEREGITV